MSQITPFYPFRNNLTVNLAVGTTSSSVSSIPATDTSSRTYQYLITNVGAGVVFIEIGTAENLAASLTTSVPVLQNTSQVFTGPPGAVIAAIAAATGNTLYITRGEGL
jgi:hypothetical protein